MACGLLCTSMAADSAAAVFNVYRRPLLDYSLGTVRSVHCTVPVDCVCRVFTQQSEADAAACGECCL